MLTLMFILLTEGLHIAYQNVLYHIHIISSIAAAISYSAPQPRLTGRP